MSNERRELDDRGPSETVRFDLLADDLRRELLRELVAAGPDARLRLEAVASAVGPEGDRAVALELHHVHLPKLDAVGAVEYDPDRNVVAVTDLIHTLDPDR